MAMWACGRCGRENDDPSRFCQYCGAAHHTGIAANENLDGLQPESIKRRLAESIYMRRQTDRWIFPGWALIPLLFIASSMGIYVLAILDGFLQTDGDYDLMTHFYVWGRNVLVVIFGILLGLLIYRLLSRINMHIYREERLRAELMGLLRASARSQGKEQEIIGELLQLSAFDGQATVYEKKLSPRRWGWGMALLFVGGAVLQTTVYAWMMMMFEWRMYNDWLWIVLSIGSFLLVLIAIAVVVLLFYVAVHLTRAIHAHELRWHGFTASASLAMKRLGLAIDTPMNVPAVKERSIVLYAVLTIVTLGFFGIYWLYALIVDPNRHFKSQRDFEDKLLKSLSLGGA